MEQHRQILVHKTRQLLISWLIAARLVHKCNFNRGEELICVSRGGMYSREIGLRSEVILNNLPGWMSQKVKPNRQFGEYRFMSTDSKYMCLSADDDTGRSFSPSGIYFDEVAFFPHGSQVMASLAPLLEEEVDFFAVSTGNGEDALFYPMWHRKGDNVHRITLHYSQRPGRDKVWADKAKLRPGMTPAKWAREQELSWATPAGRPVYEIWNGLQAQKCFDAYNPHKPLLRGFDRGYDDPAVVWAQVNDDDQLICLHSIKGDHIARDVWLQQVKDLTNSLFPRHKSGYLDYGAADFSKPESDGYSWRKVMRKYGIILRDSQRDDIERRINSVMAKMPLRDDGKYGIIVDPDHCGDLIKGLSGGYCWPDKPDFQGKLKPLKNKFSHETDCLGHICDNHFRKDTKPRRVNAPRKFDPITGRPI